MDIAAEFELDPDIVYLNHAAVSPWPRRTREAVCRFAEQNARRGSESYAAWLATEGRLRERLARLINARSSDEIALLKSTSEGLSLVAHGLDWQPGQRVVFGRQEFPSNRIVWESLARYGVEPVAVDLAVPDPEAALMRAAETGGTRLLAVSPVQYADGLRLDIERLGRFCEDREILFCVDAIQSLGALPFDVRRCRADFVAADGHKWLLGPEGLALFYCRRELVPSLRLHEYGWHMVEALGDFDRRDWAPARSARRFECGSPNLLGAHALEASLSLIEEVGMNEVARAVMERSDHLVSRLQDMADRYQLLTPLEPERRAGIVTFTPRTGDPETLFEHLRSHGVQCALRGGGIRFSPHFYTPLAALDRALDLLSATPKPRRSD